MIILVFSFPGRAQQAPEISSSPQKPRLITLDFNNVDLPVFVKFISELTRKNFIIDEKVKGKITIFSPAKITVDEAYNVFLSVLELKGFTALPVGEVIQILPSTEVPPQRSVNVYYLENANAEELLKVLSGLVARSPTPTPVRTAVRTPGEFEGPVQLFADKSTNSLIIMASPSDYNALKEVIQKLDVKRRQVYVEAVIMEIGVDKLREIGVEVQAPLRTDSSGNLTDTFQAAGGTNFGGIGTFATTGPVGLTGLAIGVVKGTFKFAGQEFLNIGALLRALQTDTNVNILSTPQILTSDNQKAEIVVGENRPFPTGQSQTVGGNVLTTIERKDVGITLRLTPQIMESSQVRLDVFQEISTISDSASQTVGGTFVGPTTNKRSANTSIIVRDQQTVVVGGLIRDNITKTVRKVPFLGDIPILGWLFKIQTRRTEKTNLLIFLTPYIVREPNEVAQIRENKAQDMKDFLKKEKVEKRERHEEVLDKLNQPLDSPPLDPGGDEQPPPQIPMTSE
jgi:general secretion pathway protein D